MARESGDQNWLFALFFVLGVTGLGSFGSPRSSPAGSAETSTAETARSTRTSITPDQSEVSPSGRMLLDLLQEATYEKPEEDERHPALKRFVEKNGPMQALGSSIA